MKSYLRNMIIFAMTLTGVWVTATSSFAHHLWVQEADDSYVVCRGSIGKRIDAYNPLCVTQILAKSTDGKALSITRTNEKERVVLTANEKPTLVSVTSVWGDRVNTTHGKKLMNRQAAEAAGLTVVSAFMSTQFSKTMFFSSGIITRALGLKFELVPLADPMTLKPGELASFKLLFDGHTLAGIPILTDDNREFQTNDNGVGKMIIAKSGVCLLYATHRIPADTDSGLDFLKFMTFLTFEVK